MENLDNTQPKVSVSFITPCSVPLINTNIDSKDCELLLEPSLKDQAEIFHENNTIVIRLKNPENSSYDEVKINQSLFNSKEAQVCTPKFIFEKSSLKQRSYNYLDQSSEDSNLVLNINQVLYMIIHHRLSSFRKYNLQYTFLLQQDINNLSQFLVYNEPVSYNAKQKTVNTFVIVPASTHSSFKKPFGESLGIKPTEEEWHPILQDLAPFICTSSDGSMHKKGKLTLSIKQPIYRSPGFTVLKNNTFLSLFEPKQNLPARLKTHLIGDAKALVKPDMSNIQQDCVLTKNEDGTLNLVSKDSTLKKGIVVFASMEKDTKRFIAGEAEISSNIADTLVYNTDSVHLSFISKQGETIYHELGKKVHVGKNDQVLLGYDSDFLPVYLPHGVRSYTVTKIISSGSGGLSKLYFESVMKAGNARITSNTGLKFVSKVMTDLGTIYIPKNSEEVSTNPKEFAPTVVNYLKQVDNSELEKYLRVDTDQFKHNTLELKPDVIVGMNAVKANTATHCNTIALAQACLAVDLGYYTPKLKHGFEKLLNSLDEAEINEARLSLPDFFYIDRYGQKQKVIIGLAFLNFTELGSVYTTVKKQSFAFFSGKNIYDHSTELSKHIFDNYIEKDKKEIAEELYKVLHDKRGLLARKDKIPRYTPKHIRANSLFTQEDMLLRKTNVTNRLDSKLLDEDFNKGFYLDFNEYSNGCCIRIPSAKILKNFVGRLPDGLYSFSPFIINISKIISNIIGNEKYPNMNINFIFNKKGDNQKRMTSANLYFNSVQGVLYSSEESSMMLVQSLLKPKIMGIGMKQVVDHLIPKDVIVITDYRKYKKLMSVYKEEREVQEVFDTLQTTLEEDYDPFVEELFSNIITDSCSKEAVNHILDDVPRCLAIRNPSLWTSQICTARIWSLDHLSLYLSRLETPIKLDSYLHPKHNRDIVLISTYLCLIQKSDCDGE